MRNVQVDLRRFHSADSAFDKFRHVKAVIKYRLAEDLSPHLLDSLFREELKRCSDCNGRDTLALKTNLLHGVDLAGGLISQVSLGIKGLPGLNLGLVDQELRNRLSWTSCTPCSLANMLRLRSRSRGDHLSSTHFPREEGWEKEDACEIGTVDWSTIDEDFNWWQLYIKILPSI